MDKKELLKQQIANYEKQIQKNKYKRAIVYIGIIAIIIFLIFFKDGAFAGIKDFIGNIGAAIMLSIVYFYINIILFVPLVNAANEENNELKRIKDEYDALLQQNNNEIKKEERN